MAMTSGSNIFWSAKSEETLVHPDYRGQGVFESMYALLLERLREIRVPVIWGFTPATRPFVRVGFHIPLSTSQIIFPLKRAGLLEIAAKGEVSPMQDIVLKALAEQASSCSRPKGRLRLWWGLAVCLR